MCERLARVWPAAQSAATATHRRQFVLSVQRRTADSVFDVTVVTVDGTMTRQRLTAAQIKQTSGVHVRDLLAVDTASPRVTPSILPRRDCIVMTMSHVRALVLCDRIMLFGTERAGSQALASEMADYLSTHREEVQSDLARGHAFETMAVEMCLSSVVDKYAKRVRFCTPVVRTLLASVRSQTHVPDERQLHRLFPLNQSIEQFSVSSAELIKCIKVLLADDDELAKMCLTAHRRAVQSIADDAAAAGTVGGVTREEAMSSATAAGIASLVEPTRLELDDLEELLQLYHRRISGINQDTNALLSNIASAQQIVKINLGNHRNHLIHVNLKLTMLTAGVSIGTFTAGVFGMNLHSGLEEVPVLFYGVTGFSIVLGAMFYAYYDHVYRTCVRCVSVVCVARDTALCAPLWILTRVLLHASVSPISLPLATAIAPTELRRPRARQWP